MSTQTNPSPYSIHQGTFKVDASGQGVYHVPIQLPPGVNNHNPQLALVYNHRQGNGICGVGWNIGGLSAISRVNANRATDGFMGAVNFDENDRFALDGQRLINYNGSYGGGGTVYYTEIHNWKQVIAGATAMDGFTVYMKNGEQWCYGTTPDSRILTEDGVNVRVWALASVTDLNGNAITYSYTTSPAPALDNTENYYLASVKYGGITVSFNYSVRTPDVMVTYLGGYKITTSCLLDTISITLNAGELISTYTLNYQASIATQLNRLHTIMIADGEGNCLPPMQFTWQDITLPSFDTSQPVSPLLNQSDVVQSIPMDINGDGLTDIVQVYQGANNLKAVPFTATANSSGVVTYTQQQEIVLGNYGPVYQVLTADVNGNGMSDLIVVYPDNSNNGNLSIDVFISTGDSLNAAITTQTSDPWQGSDSINFYVIDADGDGRSDLVQAYTDSSTGSPLLSFNTYLSQFDGSVNSYAQSVTTSTGQQSPASNQDLWAIDVNGDGIVDMVLLWQDKNRLLNTTSFITQDTATGLQLFANQVESNLNTSFSNQVTILPADVNGDGITDIIQVFEGPSSSLTIQSFLSTANGGFTAGPVSSFSNQVVNQPQFYPLGFNGGRQTSLISNWLDVNNNWNFTLFNSSPNGSFSQVASVNTQTSFPALNFAIGDVNGDGKADVLQTYCDQDNNCQLQPFTSSGSYPDLLNTVTDMLGNNTAITYLPITNSSVYSANGDLQYPKTSPVRYPAHLSPAQYPIQEVLGEAVYVVATYTGSNDSSLNRFGHLYQYHMQYAGARIDLTGRGWEGFESVSKLNMQTGKSTITVYNQDFPYTGTIAATCIEADGNISNDPKVPKGNSNVLLNQALNTYQSVQHINTTPFGTAYEIQPTGNLLYHYDYGQTNFDYLLAKSFGYDSYGNKNMDIWWGYIAYIDPSSIISTNPFPLVSPNNPAEVVYTYKEFQNDILASGWALGYLLNEKESANSADADISTFQPGDYNLSCRSYFANNYNLQTQSHWDDSNSCFLTTSFTYDVYGNRLTETKPGNITTKYEYETAYNTYLCKVTSPPTEGGIHIVTYCGYDPRFGTRVAEQDANGCIHTITLDGFGRKIAEQGPVPAGCLQNDPNQVTPLVTGTTNFITAVTTARVITLESISYENDGFGGIYAQHDALQQFPDDTNRDYYRQQKYIDGLGRESQLVAQTGLAAGNSVILITYDACGKQATKSLAFFGTNLVSPTAPFTATYAYDVLGRPVCATYPAGPDGSESTTHTWAYAAGEVITMTEAPEASEQYVQVITNHFYNGKQHQTQSVIPSDNNATTVFSFDALGRRLTSTDPTGMINTISYDSLNRKSSYNNPDQNTTGAGNALTYSYDPLSGKLKSITDISNAVAAYSYDLLGRITSQTFTDGRKFQFSYDNATNGIGNLASVIVQAADNTQESGRVFDAYDTYGNAIHETLTINGAPAPFITQFVFDPQRRIVSQTNPDSSVLIRTYQSGVLTEQSIDGAWIKYPLNSFTPAGQFSQMQYSNGLNITYQYNPSGIRYGETVQNGAQPALLDFSYNYDQLNQLLSITESVNDNTEQFTYLNKRLATAEVAGFAPGNGAYTYDTGGNILSKDGNDYSDYYGHFPKTIKAGPDIIYSATQDDCGRTHTRTRDGETISFSYNDLGNVTSVVNGTTTLRNILSDDLGNRIRETQEDGTVIFYVSSVYQLKINAGGTNIITKYLSDEAGPAASIETVEAANTTLFFRRDHKTNITHIFDDSGAIQTVVAYDGYGLPQLISGQGNDSVTYEHNPWDTETGLYYFGARYYDPMTGRFLTPDSHLGAKDHLRADVWNRFAFELNNPINHIDPTGHFSWKALGEGLLASLTSVLVTAVTLNPAMGVLAEAGVQTAFDHGNGKTFGLHVAADAATDAINDVVSIPAIVLAPETGGASLVAYGAVSGALTGAASGFLDSLADQKIMHNSSNIDWGQVGYSTAVSAGIGTAVGAIGGKTGVLSEMKTTSKGFFNALVSADGKVLSDFVSENALAIGKWLGFKITFSEYISPYHPDPRRHNAG